MQGTTLGFLRDILKEDKLHLKSKEVIHLEIPYYGEISVKNLYADAMGDDVLRKYLPSSEQLSNKLPERKFFFGVLSTLRKQYMDDIIKEAHAKRYKLQDNDSKQEGIAISEAWMSELMKHPYYSSKNILIHASRKTWDWHISDERAC